MPLPEIFTKTATLPYYCFFFRHLHQIQTGDGIRGVLCSGKPFAGGAFSQK
jgi:hypothetical protein